MHKIDHSERKSLPVHDSNCYVGRLYYFSTRQALCLPARRNGMTVLSEKLISLVLALGISAFSFNTLIV